MARLSIWSRASSASPPAPTASAVIINPVPIAQISDIVFVSPGLCPASLVPGAKHRKPSSYSDCVGNHTARLENCPVKEHFLRTLKLSLLTEVEEGSGR